MGIKVTKRPTIFALNSKLWLEITSRWSEGVLKKVVPPFFWHSSFNTDYFFQCTNYAHRATQFHCDFPNLKMLFSVSTDSWLLWFRFIADWEWSLLPPASRVHSPHPRLQTSDSMIEFTHLTWNSFFKHPTALYIYHFIFFFHLISIASSHLINSLRFLFATIVVCWGLFGAVPCELYLISGFGRSFCIIFAAPLPKKKLEQKLAQNRAEKKAQCWG